MTSDGTDLLRTVSRWTMERMRRLGATVTDTSIEATEEQLWKGMSPSHRRQLELKGNLTVTGGSSAPDWVPANAKIYIDLIAPGRAWTEADGEVAINTLLGSDPNTENGWSASSYDAANLNVDGYSFATTPPALIGAARTAVINGATVRVQEKSTTAINDLSGAIAILAANGHDAIEIDINSSGITFETYGGPANGTANGVINGSNDISDIVNALAFTVTNARFEIASNGSSVTSSALVDADRPAANPLVAVLVAISPKTSHALQSITIYDPLPSTAGLSALSETSVTNTAPTSLRATNWRAAAYSTSTGDHAITLSSALLANVGSDNLPILMLDPAGEQVNDFGMIDPQGNPLATVSLVSASNPIIQMWSSSGDVDIGSVASRDCYVTIVGSPPDIQAGDYYFTLRATDPGGLYVEQEFTITVTA